MAKIREDQQALLDRVEQARRRAKREKAALRAHYDELYEQAIAELDVATDLAVRKAADAGCKISWIQRAYETRDFNTIKGILDRTPSTVEVERVTAQAERYEMQDGALCVTYDEFGPNEVSGSAIFDIVMMDEGDPMFSLAGGSDEVSRVLDGKFDGFYYEDAVKWLRSN